MTIPTLRRRTAVAALGAATLGLATPLVRAQAA